MPKVRKEKELASDLHGDNFYNDHWQRQDPAKPQFVDFEVKNLPANMTEDKLKSIVGVKHIVGVQTDTDNIKNTCVGTGRVKFRVGEGESAADVQGRLAAEGFEVNGFKPQTSKKIDYTNLAGVDWNNTNVERRERRLTGKNADGYDRKERRAGELASDATLYQHQ